MRSNDENIAKETSNKLSGNRKSFGHLCKKALMHPPAPKNSHGKIPEPHFNPRKPSGKNSPSVLEPEKQRDAPSRKRKPPLPASSGGRIYPKPLFNQVHRQLRAQAQFVIGVMVKALSADREASEPISPRMRAAERFKTKSSDSFSERMISASPVGPAALHSSSHFWGSFSIPPEATPNFSFPNHAVKT